MELEQALMERRTVRRYSQKNIPDDELSYLIEAARQASCARNDQRLRYVIVRTPELVSAIFSHTAWAGAVTPKRNPEPGVSAPVAFIAVTGAADIADSPLLQTDCGAAIQTIQLAAWGKGIGCCWLGSINRKEIHSLLELPEDIAVLYLIALGYADEKPVSEDIDDPEQVKYYLDGQDLLHVPKLSVKSLTTWK